MRAFQVLATTQCRAECKERMRGAGWLARCNCDERVRQWDLRLLKPNKDSLGWREPCVAERKTAHVDFRSPSRVHVVNGFAVVRGACTI